MGGGGRGGRRGDMRFGAPWGMPALLPFGMPFLQSIMQMNPMGLGERQRGIVGVFPESRRRRTF